MHLDVDGSKLFETEALQMPYDACPLPDGGWLVNLIRARAVLRLSHSGEVLSEIPVGGYPCSLQRLSDGNVLVAGWDDDVPGFVRELTPDGEVAWQIEGLRWPWKAERLSNGDTLTVAGPRAHRNAATTAGLTGAVAR